MTKPIYRDDIKGQVKQIMADCQAQMAGEIRNSSNFVFLPKDTEAYQEYAVYLTLPELQRCFKAAQAA